MKTKLKNSSPRWWGLARSLVRRLFSGSAKRTGWESLSLQIRELRSLRDVAGRIGDFGLTRHYSDMMTEAAMKRDLIYFPNVTDERPDAAPKIS